MNKVKWTARTNGITRKNTAEVHPKNKGKIFINKVKLRTTKLFRIAVQRKVHR